MIGNYTYSVERRLQMNNNGEYIVLKWKEEGKDQFEDVLDLSKLSFIKDPTKVVFEKMVISSDHKKIAFCLDLKGTEKFIMYVMDLDTNLIQFKIENCF